MVLKKKTMRLTPHAMISNRYLTRPPIINSYKLEKYAVYSILNINTGRLPNSDLNRRKWGKH